MAAAFIEFALTAANASAQAPNGAARIGYLETGPRASWFEAFRRGLADLGYVENRTIVIERRSGTGHVEQLPDLAAELVRLEPRLLVASSPPAALATKRATATIPIVVANATDLVGLGLVESLARPGGNVTGLANQSTGLSAKRLELLAEIVPGLRRVAVVWDPGNDGSQLAHRELQAAAVALHMELVSLEVTRIEDLDAAFEAANARASGITVLNSPMIGAHIDMVVATAARQRVPTIYTDTRYTEAGGLLSYGTNISDLHRRAAVFVDKILKGAKPADLPVEQASKFELVVNLKTAKALGIAIPQAILVRTDEVIE